jgi:hypothetical protein
MTTITLEIPDHLLAWLDEQRGDMPIEKYIVALLEKIVAERLSENQLIRM